ncbi:ubinuclein-2a isoform X1 [Phycodurus eques]|uniref:ubinuclein-2a isoform X1 n=1 Tax=Phycodurus eques TaxID=693459 RepID=UPI002ACD5CA0|nr:ubinuclein-2a isoform X1 [Phycodurus eques]
MAEPRKVQFVTLSAFATGAASESRKRRLEDEADYNLSEDDEVVAAAEGLAETGAGGAASRYAKAGERDKAGAEKRATVRLNLPLSEPDDRASAEFNYGELLHNLQTKNKPPSVTAAPNPDDPFDDDERERLQVEALAKKFENKYGNMTKKRKDRMQDLIDIGFGYDETDPFIDNSEAYDELVPASLTTKLGGFYINTGTLQFRAASDSEGEDDANANDDSEQAKMRKKKEMTNVEEKKSNEPKQGVAAVSLHRPEKKKRKKLMKDSLYLAAMLRRFTMEKEQMRKNNLSVAPAGLAGGVANKPCAADAAKHLLASDSAQPPVGANAAANSDLLLADLTGDPAVMSLLGSANEKELQDILGDLDFGLLDGDQQHATSTVRENGILGVGASGQKGGTGGGVQGRGLGSSSGLYSPPQLPGGLPPPLVKRIEDLRTASRQFDQEGRKKFFTLDMNNILLDIELQVQKQPPDVRSGIYAHLEAFVPCNKEALLKRLKKLSLKIQVRAAQCDNGLQPTPTPHSKDDRMRMPLLELQLAVCGVMPEQIARYNMDCMAKVAKQHSEEGDKNGSEDDDEEKPGKRVMGPRKKFVWDDKLRSLLCTLVRVKLTCYDMESQCSLSVEDYLKAFLENEVKPLWPKGWMQARILFKESVSVHIHLTGSLAKRRVVPGPKAKAKEGVWIRKPPPSMPPALRVPTSSTSSVISTRPPPLPSPSELICLSDSLDEDLSAPSLDSISHALALLSNAAKGLGSSDSPLSPPPPQIPTSSPPPVTPHYPAQLPCAAPTKVESPAATAGKMTTSTSLPTSSSTSSRAPCRPADTTYSLVKVTGAPSQRQVTTATANNRPSAITVGKMRPHPAPSPPKQRPPPTASPLMPPHHQKALVGSPMGTLGVPQSVVKGGLKMGVVSSNGGVTPSSSPSPQPRSIATPHPALLSFCPASTPSAVCQTTPSTQGKARAQHPQPNFITPMQATLTKPSHSTNSSPIIKLTPRPPPPTPPPSSSSSSSPSPSSSPSHPPGPKHQYSPKTFRPPFGITGSVQGTAAKPTPGAFTGAPKPPPATGTHNSPGNNKTPSAVGHANKTPPPPSPSGSANHGQRQRPVGVAVQNLKPGNGWATSAALATPSTTSHLSQVSAAGGPLLGGPSTLPLGFGMLGGLVPVSLPFQFPPLLNFSHPGAPGPAGMGSAPGSNSGYPLAQSDLLELYKSLQSGSQAALPPHLQLAFSDTNQSQGGDKRKPSH